MSSRRSSQHILMTGATSGFGQLAMQQLLDRGHRVLAAVRCGDQRLQAEGWQHPQLSGVHMDLTVPEAGESLSLAIQQKLDGQLNVLLNCAGYGLLGPIELQTVEQIKKQMQINFLAPLQLIQTSLPFLKKSQGKILNVTSMAAFTVFPFYGTYAASKHALAAATEALYYELRPLGVQVASIEPGGYRTGFRSRVEKGNRETLEILSYQDRLKRFERFLQVTCEKIEKNPQDVARLLVDLCERDKIHSRYVVGVDAHLNHLLRRLIPSRWWVPWQGWFYEKFFF